MKKFFKYFIIFFLPFFVYSQELISGKVLFKSDNLDYPIEGANIYWLNSSKGTVTNQEGEFSIEKTANNSKLIISYIGFVNDTIIINYQSTI